MKRFAILAALLLASTAARAELVAQYILPTSTHQGVIIQLDNQPGRSGVCDEGSRSAYLAATSTRMLPDSIPYAYGCWYILKSGTVVLHVHPYDGGGEFVREFNPEIFTTTAALKNWGDYFPY